MDKERERLKAVALSGVLPEPTDHRRGLGSEYFETKSTLLI